MESFIKLITYSTLGFAYGYRMGVSSSLLGVVYGVSMDLVMEIIKSFTLAKLPFLPCMPV